jgi:uracil-DNA glycosylase
MHLPAAWEKFLSQNLDIKEFYTQLKKLLQESSAVTPRKELIFNVFNYMKPNEVKCVLYGEDPYPRITSANGVAFWDLEIKSWQDRTNGSSLKNIFKALLTAEGLADYKTPIAECRIIASRDDIKTPGELFELWLGQGVLLVNTSLTFASSAEKLPHFKFWQPFQQALIKFLNSRKESPFYILWGRKAQAWEDEIKKTIDNPGKIIKQGHPAFIHHFMDKDNPAYSPFVEIRKKTGLQWL